MEIASFKQQDGGNDDMIFDDILPTFFSRFSIV